MKEKTAQEVEGKDPRRWKILAVLLIALFMTHVSISNINVLLPSMQHGFGATTSQLQWILSGYTLTFGVILIPAGRAGDFFGRRTIFMWGVTIFVAASIWAVLATTPAWLIVSRLLQGVGSGLLNPQGIGFIQQYFRGSERGRAFGAYGTVVGIATTIGPLLGGLIVQLFGSENGWRAVIALNIPLGVATLIFAARWMPKYSQPVKERGGAGVPIRETLTRLDIVGALLAGFAVLAIMLPFMESGTSKLFWLALPTGLLILWAWITWEQKLETNGRTPMVKLSMFKTESYRNGVVIGSFYFLGFTSVWVLVAIYMQDALGYSAFHSGLVIMPGAIAAAVTATVTGRLVTKHGRVVVIAGIYMALTGMLLSIAVILLQTRGLANEWWLLATLALIGAAQGAVISPNNTITLAEVPPANSGSLGGVLQTGQRIGTSVGISVITAVTFTVLPATNWAIAVASGFTIMILIVSYVLYVAYKDLRRQRALKS